MKVLERGTIYIDELGNVFLRGWRVQGVLETDKLLKWIIRQRKKKNNIDMLVATQTGAFQNV